MPYIPQNCRAVIESNQRNSQHLSRSPGELNYTVTRLLIEYLGETPNYERYNAVVGVLECAKLELYRRMVVPYEEKKKAENGDVYPLEKGRLDDAGEK